MREDNIKAPLLTRRFGEIEASFIEIRFNHSLIPFLLLIDPNSLIDPYIIVIH